jgi:hypothetical protein
MHIILSINILQHITRSSWDKKNARFWAFIFKQSLNAMIITLLGGK